MHTWTWKHLGNDSTVTPWGAVTYNRYRAHAFGDFNIPACKLSTWPHPLRPASPELRNQLPSHQPQCKLCQAYTARHEAPSTMPGPVKEEFNPLDLEDIKF